MVLFHQPLQRSVFKEVLNSMRIKWKVHCQSLLNCESLEVLDVGDNKLEDAFPHWLESLPMLQVLVL